MKSYRVYFTYRGGRFDGRKGVRTVRANDKEEAGSRVRYALDRTGGGMMPRYAIIDRIEPLSQEDK